MWPSNVLPDEHKHANVPTDEDVTYTGSDPPVSNLDVTHCSFHNPASINEENVNDVVHRDALSSDESATSDST